MSKLIKSSFCVEALPCRLEPADVDAFFINDETYANKTVVGVDTFDDSDNPLEMDLARIAERADALITQASEQAAQLREQAALEAQLKIDAARQEAERILTNARNEGQQIIKTAGNEGIQLREQARNEGFACGQAEARQAWEGKLTEALQLIADIEKERVERITGSEPELLKLAGAIAEKIIGAELVQEPSQQLDLVKSALSRVVNASRITLRVHPDDLQYLSEHLPEVRMVFNGPTPLQLAGDEAIPSGGCFIETERGSVDARIKVQLEQIVNELVKTGYCE